MQNNRCFSNPELKAAIPCPSTAHGYSAQLPAYCNNSWLSRWSTPNFRKVLNQWRRITMGQPVNARLTIIETPISNKPNLQILYKHKYYHLSLIFHPILLFKNTHIKYCTCTWLCTGRSTHQQVIYIHYYVRLMSIGFTLGSPIFCYCSYVQNIHYDSLQ